MKEKTDKKYKVVQFDDMEAVPCPCGLTKRAFASQPGGVASIHRVTITKDSKLHYHKATTEIYYVLSGHGKLQLDEDILDVGPGNSVLIKPGCRHRAIGELEILNIPIPAFDPSDEWFD
ncbi:MAG: cupin domain-containing protein [Planctomycetota bacterium]